MKLMQSMMVAVSATGVMALAGVSSGSYSTHSSEASFNAAVGGAGNVVSQDFQGFSTGDDMTGPSTFLGGVEGSTNLGALEVFGAVNGLFGLNGGTTARADGVAYYQFDYALPYLSAAFWIRSWDPNSSPATIDVFFDGGSSDSFQISQTGLSETDDQVFLGITSGVAITRIVIHEPIENDTLGSEEIGFSWVAVSRVPGAGVPAAMALGMIGLGARRRRSAF